ALGEHMVHSNRGCGRRCSSDTLSTDRAFGTVPRISFPWLAPAHERHEYSDKATTHRRAAKTRTRRHRFASSEAWLCREQQRRSSPPAWAALLRLMRAAPRVAPQPPVFATTTARGIRTDKQPGIRKRRSMPASAWTKS